MNGSFDDLCRSLATSMSRRDAVKLAAATFLAGIATTMLSLPALAHRKRHKAFRATKRTEGRLRDKCNPGEGTCASGGGQKDLCCPGTTENCCSPGCCPIGFEICIVGSASASFVCCPGDGSFAGSYTDKGDTLCCEKDYRGCFDGTCCHKDTICVVDQAIKDVKGCCPPRADGSSLMCGLTCCTDGEECDKVHLQCKEKGGGRR